MSTATATAVDRKAPVYGSSNSRLDQDLEASISLLAKAITTKVDHGVVLFSHRADFVSPDKDVSGNSTKAPSSVSRL